MNGSVFGLAAYALIVATLDETQTDEKNQIIWGRAIELLEGIGWELKMRDTKESLKLLRGVGGKAFQKGRK